MKKIKDYIFSLSQGIYTPLAGVKTVFQMGTQLNTDAVSTAITLPFPFTIGEKVETTLFISNNGFVTFGDKFPRVGEYSPISSTVTTNPFDNLISAFGNQLIAATSGSPEISHGTNPSGDFVVQFQDVGILNTIQAKFTFQIILKADGKTVQVVFGPNCVGGEVSTRASQIGLRGKQSPRVDGVGNVYATPETKDYINLSMSNGNYNVFQPNNNLSGGVAPGKTNASAVAARQVAGMVMPQAGLTYQWIP